MLYIGNGNVKMKKIRKHIHFYGSVQGVGFRYRSCYAADAAGATGWVRNNPDTSVTMEIQGTREQIDNVINALEQGRFIQIDHMDVTDIPVIESERSFRPLL